MSEGGSVVSQDPPMTPLLMLRRVRVRADRAPAALAAMPETGTIRPRFSKFHVVETPPPP
jgi:hypothetical protein